MTVRKAPFTDFLSYFWLCPTPCFIEVKIKIFKFAYGGMQRSYMHTSTIFDKDVHLSNRIENTTISPESVFIPSSSQLPSPIDNHWADFYHLMLDLPVLGLGINGIIRYAPIYSWLLLFSIIFMKSSFCMYQGFILFSCWAVLLHIKIHQCVYLSSCWWTFRFFFLVWNYCE